MAGVSVAHELEELNRNGCYDFWKFAMVMKLLIDNHMILRRFSKPGLILYGYFHDRKFADEVLLRLALRRRL